MAPVRVVKMATDQVVCVVAMRYGLVSAAGSMYVFFRVPCALMSRRAVLRISFCDIDYMFIGMFAVWIVKVPVVQITDMVVMHEAGVATLGPMWMSMIFVLRQDTISHFIPPR